jgi:hypothetical protein
MLTLTLDPIADDIAERHTVQHLISGRSSFAAGGQALPDAAPPAAASISKSQRKAGVL